jgi:isopenicillin N synthase-like dioxygenase
MATSSFDAVPVVDLRPFLDGSDKAGVARRAAEICERIGFLYVTGHGVPEATIAAARQAALDFFDLPEERKREVHISAQRNHRGWRGFGEVNLDPNGPKDIKESYKVGPELPADDPIYLAGQRMYGPNAWPRALPGFRDAVWSYFAAVDRLRADLFRLFALALDLPEAHFAPFVTKPIAQLNLVHYPALAPDALRASGVGAHTDYECFTILWQDENGGLEARNAAGDWVAVPPVPGTFVVNIGDMMALWSNDRFASTLHRARNTSGRRRLSFPMFCGTNHDAVIECLPSCTGPGRPPRHAPVVAGAWQAMKIAAGAQPVAGTAG